VHKPHRVGVKRVLYRRGGLLHAKLRRVLLFFFLPLGSANPVAALRTFPLLGRRVQLLLHLLLGVSATS
jgi:hypothetical protein